VQGFVFGVVAEEKEYGSVLVLTDDSSATLWIGQPYGAEGGLIGTAPSLPPSWQHSHGPDLSTAQPCWPPSAPRQLMPLSAAAIALAARTNSICGPHSCCT
jgi:hypothetical protein